MNDDRVTRLVAPFYLKMMRLNAIEHGADLAPAIVEVGSTADVDDLVALLRDPWRATVMGAWLSILRGEELLADEVLHALDRSHGSLDAPPLAIAAAMLAGPRALPTLSSYVQRDRQAAWGAASFVAAVIRYLGGSDVGNAPEVEDEHLRGMLAVGDLLRRGGGSSS